MLRHAREARAPCREVDGSFITPARSSKRSGIGKTNNGLVFQINLFQHSLSGKTKPTTIGRKEGPLGTLGTEQRSRVDLGPITEVDPAPVSEPTNATRVPSGDIATVENAYRSNSTSRGNVSWKRGWRKSVRLV